MNQIMQGETLYVQIALSGDDNKPYELPEGSVMKMMVSSQVGNTTLYVGSTDTGEIESLGGGLFAMTIEPRYTSKMLYENHIWIKISDTQNQDVSIGSTGDKCKPSMSIYVIPNPIYPK